MLLVSLIEKSKANLSKSFQLDAQKLDSSQRLFTIFCVVVIFKGVVKFLCPTKEGISFNIEKPLETGGEIRSPVWGQVTLAPKAMSEPRVSLHLFNSLNIC